MSRLRIAVALQQVDVKGNPNYILETKKNEWFHVST